MKKLSLVTTLILCLISQIQAQYNFQYAYEYGSIFSTRDVKTMGNSGFISNLVNGTLNIDPRNSFSLSAPSLGASQYVIGEYDTNGDLVDYIHIEGTITANDFAINSQGEILIAIAHTGAVYLEASTSQAANYSPGNTTEVYLTVAKYSSNGTLIESRDVKIGDQSYTSQIQVDFKNDNDFYLMVNLRDQSDMSFGAAPQNFASGTFAGIYSNFSLQSGRSFQANFNLGGIGGDSNGNVFIGGFQTINNNTINIGNSITLSAPTGQSRTFLIKYNSNMDYQDHIDFGEGALAYAGRMRVSNDKIHYVGFPSNENIVSLNQGYERLYLDPDNPSQDFTAPNNNYGYVVATYNNSLGLEDVLKFGYGTSTLAETSHARFYFSVNAGKKVVTIQSSKSATQNVDYLEGNGNKHLIGKGVRAIMVFDEQNEPLYFASGLNSFFSQSALLQDGSIFYTAAITAATDLDFGNGVSNSNNSTTAYFSLISPCTTSSTPPISEITVCGGETINQSVNGVSISLPGSYYYFTQSGTNCPVRNITNIIQPDELVLNNIIKQDISCSGSSDGSLEIDFTGGTAPFEYSLTSGATYSSLPSNNIVTGLGKGTYLIKLRDANNCESSITNIVINEPDLLELDAANDQSPTSCGGNNGKIQVGTIGGTMPYTYSLDNGATTVTPNSSGFIEGLMAGSYTLLVTDANGCTASDNFTINDPTSITASASILDSPCFGESTGSITLTATQGVGPYQYSIDGTNFQSSATFDQLAAGNYSLTIKDASNCRVQVNATVNQPLSALTFDNISIIDNLCNGATNGTINISASGGTTPYEYSIDNGSSYQSSGSFTSLTSGSYTLIVRDFNGCTETTQSIVQEPSPISASISGTTQISCNGANDGTITLAVSGGTGPYEVSADGGTFNALPSNGMFTGIGPVTIQNLTIRDANGCTTTINGFTMTEPDAISNGGIIVQNVSCNGLQDGQIEVDGTSGGTGSIQFSIDGVNFQSSEVFTGLSAGNYTLTMKDANNCSATSTFTIAQPNPIDLEATIVNISCNGNSDGGIIATTQGGTAPYEYSINGIDFQAGSFSGLSAGNYTLYVRDANGCIESSTYTISEPAALSVGINSTQSVSCSGGSDGSVTVNVSGGNPTYQYSLDGQTFGDDSILTGLSAGNYTLSVKDNQGCTTSVSFSISEPTAISVTATTSNITCNGANDGSANISATGGTGTFTYSMDGTNFQSANAFTGLSAGTYSITVKDANECTTSISLNITEPDALVLNFEAVDITCNGANDGQIAGFTTGGTSPYQYSIDGTNFQTGVFSGLNPGNYTLTVKDATGCTTSSNVVINEPAILSASTNSVTNVSCNGANNGSALLSVTGGSTPYNYSLDGNAYNASVDLSSLAPGNYTVYVLDANNCETTTTFSITEPSAISVSAVPTSVQCNGGTDGSISIAASGGTGNFSYSIDGTNFQSSNEFSGLQAGDYTLSVKDQNNCVVTATTTIAEPSAIVATITTSNVLCNGGNNGSLTVSASGGTGTLMYSIDGTVYQSGSVFSNLSASSYTIFIKDVNDCVTSVSSSITEPIAITTNASVTNVLCNGESDGSITVTPTGGTGTFEYSIDGTNFQTSSTFTNLSAGNYSVIVRDANACTASVNATISEPSALSVSASLTDDNTINASATGGTAPYQYSIDGTNFQSSATFSGLTNGQYTITVLDSNGCTASTNTTLVVTGFENEPTTQIVQVYPNPSQDFVIVKGLAHGDLIRLLNTNGEELKSIEHNNNSSEHRLDIQNTVQGIYLISVLDKNGSRKTTRKLIIER